MRGKQQWRFGATVKKKKRKKKDGMASSCYFLIFQNVTWKNEYIGFLVLLTNHHISRGSKHVYYLTVSVGQDSGHSSPGPLIRVLQDYNKVLTRSAFSPGASTGQNPSQAYSGCWQTCGSVAEGPDFFLAVAGGCPQVLQVTHS